MATKKESDQFKINQRKIRENLAAQQDNISLEEAELYKIEQQKQAEQFASLMRPKEVRYKEFQLKIKSAVSSLLEKQIAIQMAKNFINIGSPEFYTNILRIKAIEYFVGTLSDNLDVGDLLYFSNKSQRNFFFIENSQYLKDNYDEINKYIEDELLLFHNVLIDHNLIAIDHNLIAKELYSDLIITYVFVKNVAIYYFSDKWKSEQGVLFNDIINIDLNEAIYRYFNIDYINHSDNIILGTFTYFLMNNSKFDKDLNYIFCYEDILGKLDYYNSDKKYNIFLNKITNKQVSDRKRYTINDIDLMTGQEFELFIAQLFSKMGYETQVTKASGDQGIDVIASKNGTKIGVQVKCYSSSVGNSAIQEAVAGKTHYRLDKVIVVTNSTFTESAQQLAQSNSVLLWDRNILKDKLEDLF